MRLERPGVTLESEWLQNLCYRTHQFLQALVPFDAHPEDTRRLRGREEARVAKRELNRRTLHLSQRALNLIQPFRFSEKLQRDMKCFRPDPADIWREWAHLVSELSNPLANPGVNVESYEQAHTITSTCGAPGRAPAGWPNAECARGLRDSAAARP